MNFLTIFIGIENFIRVKNTDDHQLASCWKQALYFAASAAISYSVLIAAPYSLGFTPGILNGQI